MAFSSMLKYVASALLLAIFASQSGLIGAELVNTCGNYVENTGSTPLSCNGNGAESQALEIRNSITSEVYVASGDNVMTYDEFMTYDPPSSVAIWDLNTPRFTQFSSNCFMKSPGAPLNCTGDNCVEFTTVKVLNDTTWGSLATSECDAYYPDNSTDVVLAPPEGQVFVMVINKCQNLTFTEEKAWVLTDEWNNNYIMHMSGSNTTDGVDQAATSAVFPEGWSVAQVTLSPNPFTIWPNMQADTGECFYTIIRDSSDNSYHGIGCGGAQYPTDFVAACPAATKSGGGGPTPAPPAPSPPVPPSGAVSVVASMAVALCLSALML